MHWANSQLIRKQKDLLQMGLPSPRQSNGVLQSFSFLFFFCKAAFRVLQYYCIAFSLLWIIHRIQLSVVKKIKQCKASRLCLLPQSVCHLPQLYIASVAAVDPKKVEWNLWTGRRQMVSRPDIQSKINHKDNCLSSLEALRQVDVNSQTSPPSVLVLKVANSEKHCFRHDIFT